MTLQTGDPSRVRLADKRDEEELFGICRLLHQENGEFPLNEKKVREVLARALSGPAKDRRGLVGVIGAHGSIQGSIYLEVGSPWYSDSIRLCELWNFVLPQYRSSTNSKDLIAYAKMLSDASGYPLMIGVLSNQRTEAKVRHYKQQLGSPAGAFFLYGSVTARGN